MRNNRKINLEFVNEEISVNKENKTVKCTLTFNPHIKDFSENYGCPCEEILKESPRKLSGLMKSLNGGTFTTVGVSKCSEGDEFNEQLGIQIARERARYRAEKKFYNWVYNYYFVVENTLERLARALDHSDYALYRYECNEKNLIDEL